MENFSSEACRIELQDADMEAISEDAAAPKNTLSAEDEKQTWQSLTNTVIDNARTNIQNIHNRPEFAIDQQSMQWVSSSPDFRCSQSTRKTQW
jgi:hypothetical protein